MTQLLKAIVWVRYHDYKRREYVIFFIGQVLGKGGFAKVFKAERIISADLSSEPISSSTVAVKVSNFFVT